MEFENEYQLQAFIHSVVGGQREVKFADGSRIDILTDRYAIEVKPKLTRSALLQALGQTTVYQSNCSGTVPVIAGMTPKNAEESYANAERIRQAGVQVWYIDQMNQFVDHWESQRSPVRRVASSPEQEFEIPPAAWIVWAILGFLVTMCSQPRTPRPSVATPPPPATELTAVFDSAKGSRVVEEIPSNTSVAVLQCSDGGMVQVMYSEKTGWVESEEFDRDVCGGN